MSLSKLAVDDAMRVRAGHNSCSRDQIGGAVVVYDPDDVPAWLEPIIFALDEDGDPSDAIKVVDPGEQRNIKDRRIVVEYRAGTAITGAPARQTERLFQ